MTKAEWALAAALSALCGICFLTLEINAFPHDWWFATHEVILGLRNGPESFYTPIAAPAYLYAPLRVLAHLAGYGLAEVMTAGVLTHHALTALSGWAVYKTHRILGFELLHGAAAALLFVGFIESTFILQTFMSETVIIPLLCWVLYGTLRMEAQPPKNGAYAVLWGAALGLGLSLAVITRAVPLLIAPAIALYLWPSLSADRWRRMTGALAAVLCAVTLAQMWANSHRFGHFELSHSTGLHLWNAVTQDPDILLAEQPIYQALKQKNPKIHERWWWEIGPIEGAPTSWELEDLLRPMAFDAIRRHPWTFLAGGIRDLKQTLPVAPEANGYGRADYYNPLGRERMLPAPGFAAPAVKSLLGKFHRSASRLYRWVTPGALLVGLLASVVIAVRRKSMADRDIRAWLLFASVFVGAVYASNLIERIDSRYALPYLGALAMMISMTWRLLGRAVGLQAASTVPSGRADQDQPAPLG